ncbi:MAG: phosphatidate cytidylyltransferase [Bacilli bacterium]|nr:phosphatidate cytidylyltransferase [Bacilli bacterium]
MKERFISAIIMLLITVPFVLVGNIYFAIFLLIIGEMALYEFLKFRKNIPFLIKIFSYIMLGVTILRNMIGISIENIVILDIFLYLGSLVFINDKYHYKDAFYLIGLILFLGVAFSKIILIRNLGLNHLIYLLLIAIGTDSFALFIGTKFGKTKLAPSISPNKTVEGLLGGCLVGTIVGSVFYILLVKNIINVFIVFLMTLGLSLIGEFGDLIKSSIKRYEKVKDFSNLIPGHGGIMDRVDSIIFIALIYALIINLGGIV